MKDTKASRKYEAGVAGWLRVVRDAWVRACGVGATRGCGQSLATPACPAQHSLMLVFSNTSMLHPHYFKKFLKTTHFLQQHVNETEMSLQSNTKSILLRHSATETPEPGFSKTITVFDSDITISQEEEEEDKMHKYS
ncbi:hypothetical protein E2C01_062619 [Portunus trituberculatus]|uniref:Uncharacterized protein n=1 Tax=Portunus trituberculatus TaxID=210409 RepID=A0A5B7HHT5_PORTR|nr:hypothetical protein [Portunus trituberculatus]